ncbi:putative AAA+ superfamily ATPase [Acetoanaerobium pronyense]|uniref:AAA+ superfamily ATPase n=1 Tax=Acetoanaerobium pronyense TaxID=1482736 RepID=A0ABS4KHD1_9FIRM|nr:ATP-binding protein [Acetoanaerobium pronyense]MBP2026536.1 putative AAA+ superfamily ATPase [Acetoanaerobium pronyense]
MILREKYMSKIRPFINQPIIKVLTGIRRSGKSVMLELIQNELINHGMDKKYFMSINLESKKNQFENTVDGIYEHVKRFVEKSNQKVYLFFDEIQEIEDWETLINAVMIDFDTDIYITGSNAKLLSGELATYLAGRYVEIKIYPFSYIEILDLFPTKNKQEIFQIYLVRGGMPFLYQFPIDDRSAMQYLNDIYDSIILKDIATRNKVRDIELLKRMIQFFIANIGNTFSASNISKYLKSELRSVSTETIYNYIEYCKTACFLHLVQREDLLGKKILQFQEKIYIADHGIREAVYGNNMRDINQTLENIVYMELLSRGYDVRIGKNLNNEVDFVAEEGNSRIYVQVSYLLASDETMEREFSVLESIPDNYPKYVITMDEIDRGRNGIKHMNIRDFLLMEQF